MLCLRLRLPPSDFLTADSTVAVYVGFVPFTPGIVVTLTTVPDELDGLLNAADGVGAGDADELLELLDADDDCPVDRPAAAAGRVGASIFYQYL